MGRTCLIACPQCHGRGTYKPKWDDVVWPCDLCGADGKVTQKERMEWVRLHKKPQKV